MYCRNADSQSMGIELRVSDPNYDAAGNMTYDHRGDEYVYDAENGFPWVDMGNTKGTNAGPKW